MKLTQQDIARILDIDPKTLRNWRKNKPKLYEKIMQGFAFDDAVQTAKEHYEHLQNLAESKKSQKSTQK